MLEHAHKDQEIWNAAVDAATREFARLPGEFVERLRNYVGEIKRRKKALFDVTEEVGGGRVCRQCLGACCRSGKYHFTVIDLLVFLAEEKELFSPHFGIDFCPFLGRTGCLMEPEYRPFNCIIFNCDDVELLLSEDRLSAFRNWERELRELNCAVEKLFDNRFMSGLLSNFERSGNPSEGSILFGRKNTLFHAEVGNADRMQ